MEPKGMMDKVRPQKGGHFIGKKCQKFLESRIEPKNTVSIVPIIGEAGRLSGFATPGFQISSIKTRPELF